MQGSSFRRKAFVIAGLLAAVGCNTSAEAEHQVAPATQGAPPEMVGTADSVRAFISWASSSVRAQHEAGRAAIIRAQANPQNIEWLHDELMRTYREDATRALVILAILGEMRSTVSEARLRNFVWMPLPSTVRAPSTGTVSDEVGEDPERTRLGVEQAKAIEGLAYQHTDSADAEVLRVIRGHESRTVRASAITAYLWNHANSPAARQAVLSVVRPEEAIFMDQPIRTSSESGAVFNAKLQAYLASHPEISPPPPVRLPER